MCGMLLAYFGAKVIKARLPGLAAAMPVLALLPFLSSRTAPRTGGVAPRRRAPQPQADGRDRDVAVVALVCVRRRRARAPRPAPCSQTPPVQRAKRRAAAQGRNRQCVTLDLHTAEGRDLARARPRSVWPGG